MYVMENPDSENWCHLFVVREGHIDFFLLDFNSICKKKDLTVEYNHNLFKCQIRMISYQSIWTYWTAVCTYLSKRYNY